MGNAVVKLHGGEHEFRVTAVLQVFQHVNNFIHILRASVWLSTSSVMWSSFLYCIAIGNHVFEILLIVPTN